MITIFPLEILNVQLNFCFICCWLTYEHQSNKNLFVILVKLQSQKIKNVLNKKQKYRTNLQNGHDWAH